MRDRYRHCHACGDYHWLSSWPDNHREEPPKRSLLPSPQVIRDQMSDLWHPLAGRNIDSKQEFRRETVANGGIEIGNDTPNLSRYTDTVSDDDVGSAIQKVKQGYVPNVQDEALPA